jgi:K+-sensing histidine kinase KdpD
MTEPQPPPTTEPPDISTERMRVLLTIATAVSRSLDPQEAAETALWLAIEAVELKVGMVLLLQEEGPTILASHGFSLKWLHEFHSAMSHLEGTIIDQTLAADQPNVFPDLLLAPDDAVVQLLRRFELRSLVCLPLRAPGDVNGVLLIGGHQQRTFHPGDMDLLEAIASQISTGLRNAWLFSQSWRQLEELESVAETARAVVSSLDSDEILTRIMEEVTNWLSAEAAAVLLLDPVQQELEFAAVAGPASASLKGIRLKVGQGVAGWVAQHDQPLLVPDVTRDERFHKDLDERTATITRSILCVPLRVRERLIGVVEVINKRDGRFSNADQRFLEALATFAAVAIENARLYEEARRQTQQATFYAQDLSAAYQQERKQREALDRLRYSFLNVVGHELKTPLTVVLQGWEVFKDPKRGPLSPERTEMLAILERQLNYLYRVIDGLITFAAFSARQGTMKFCDVPFEAVLDDALMLSQFKAARKNIALEDRRQEGLPTLSLDKERMSEAVVHLIDNAIKFSPEGSPVLVETRTKAEELIVRVVDSGRGIPADQLDSIWDSFVQMSTTLERGVEGLGLGLAIARYIVETHNGAISAESELGKGSTFIIRLPCPPPSTPEPV